MLEREKQLYQKENERYKESIIKDLKSRKKSEIVNNHSDINKTPKKSFFQKMMKIFYGNKK